jgi:hypothetical protein
MKDGFDNIRNIQFPEGHDCQGITLEGVKGISLERKPQIIGLS